MAKIDYTIILPTYNEKENLPLITYLIDYHMKPYNYEIIIIDDNSPDGTIEVAKRIQKVFGEDKIILKSRTGKLGLGTAYVFGLGFARGEFIVIMDADLSHHPEAIPKMIELQKKEGCDYVSGTRYALGGGVSGWTLFRKLTSKVANFLAQTMLDPDISDLTGSFRLYKKSVLQRMLSYELPKGYAFQMAIAVRAKRLGYKSGEVPIEFVDRIYGESSLGAEEITRYIAQLVQLFFSV